MEKECHLSRRSALKSIGAAGAAALAPEPSLSASGNDVDAYPEHAARYLKRLYAPSGQPFAFRENYPGGFQNWQRQARAELQLKLRLEKIAASAGNHRPVLELSDLVDMGDYTRQRVMIETEPEVRIPFWFLKPKGKGPWPLGIFPHGHDRRGHDTSAGVYADEAHQKKSLAEDRDVAVQAVKRGFVAIAPAVRGLAAWGVPDLRGRHGKQDCRSHMMHCLVAGRTAMGERVWDMRRILDWACKLPEVNPRSILMMGNSGGGLVTIFTAACDPRITVAVPSCSFAPTVSPSGYVFHCDCNVVPGLIELGGLHNVAGLIAPRFLLTVSGRKDSLFSTEAIEWAAAHVRGIYQDAGHPGRYQHRWGAEGHRFYKDLMWPFVEAALRS
jgi:dienelactone hydrolase